MSLRKEFNSKESYCLFTAVCTAANMFAHLQSVVIMWLYDHLTSRALTIRLLTSFGILLYVYSASWNRQLNSAFRWLKVEQFPKQAVLVKREIGKWFMATVRDWRSQCVCVFACPWWVLSHIASVIEGTVDQQSDRLRTTVASGPSDTHHARKHTHLYSQADMADWLRFI